MNPFPGMSRQDFRRYGKETVDYIADYMKTIQKRRVVPAIEPGYLKNLIPSEAPSRGEPWEKVMDDFEKLIMPGGSALDGIRIALLAARFEVMKELRQRFPFVEEGLLLSKLIAYCSKEVSERRR
ncbi:hypothetical protein OSTOST_24914 [Ostertagia ostertagi]